MCSSDLSVLPKDVPTVRPGTKLEFSVVDGKRGPQALSIQIIDEPATFSTGSRTDFDDLATMIEDTIKILDKVGNNYRHGRAPSGPDAERLAKVLRGIASQIEG